MNSSMTVGLLEVFLSNTTSFLLLIFTYIIPLFSTIRTIHNKDRAAYTQWLPYWLLIQLISPLFHKLLRFYRIFHLIIVLWLSLPRFQGANFIYHEIIHVYLLDRYSVEQTVDTKIHSVKLAAKDAAYNIMKEIGWGVLTQIGEIVAHVQDSIHKKNSTATQSSNKATSSPSADQHDRDEHDDDDDQDQILQKSPSKDSTQLSSFSSSSLNSLKDHSHRKEEDEQQEQQTISNASEHQQHQHDKNFNSFSSNSLASMDSTSNLKQQNYIDDFKNMLKQGLFVFAWYNPSFVNNGNGEDDSTETKHFKLRIFTFQDSERTNDDDDDEIDDDEIPSFVLNPVNASKHEHQNRKQSDAILIPITHISHIKGSGGNGIQFLALNDDEYDEDSDVQSSAIAEIELAEGDDRDTLLDGLRSLFFDLKRSIEQKEDSSFENNAMNEEEEEESEEDILNESDEVDEGIEVDELLEKEEEEIDVHEELKDLSDHGLSEEVTPLDGIMEAKNHQNSFVDIDVIDDNEANHCEKYRD